MKGIITKMKNSVEGLNSRYELAEEIISEVEGTVRKKNEKTEQNLRDL